MNGEFKAGHSFPEESIGPISRSKALQLAGAILDFNPLHLLGGETHGSHGTRPAVNEAWFVGLIEKGIERTIKAWAVKELEIHYEGLCYVGDSLTLQARVDKFSLPEEIMTISFKITDKGRNSVADGSAVMGLLKSVKS
ncbi:hypothetical protein ACFL2Q_04115 [Thermodesulfobacteriota bacterium]